MNPPNFSPLSTADPAQEPSAFDLEIGLLTINQVAAKLIPFLPLDSDPVLLVKRLIARLSLATVNVGGKIRVTVEALAAFIQEGANNAKVRSALLLPPETLSPLFPIIGRWFESPWQFEMSNWTGAIYTELDRQIPKDLAGLTITQPKNDPQAVMPVRLTPALLAILGRPVSENTILSPKRDGSAFSGMAEIFLASRLQTMAEKEIDRLAFVDSQNIKGQGIGPLYESAAAYSGILDAALAAFQASTFFSLTRYVSQGDSISPLKNTLFPTTPTPGSFSKIEPI